MIEISLREAGSAMGCPTSQTIPEMSLPRVSTDSRTLAAGDAFVALKGERFDGHEYIPEALRKGARVVVHSRDWRPRGNRDVIFLEVSDTSRALQDLATRIRCKWRGTLVAITGSMGKTTTRQFTARVLREAYRVHQSRGNLNNHIGVPLTLLELEPEHEIAVLELGMNHPGEIRRLSEICRPDLGLITNVSAAHLEFFPSIEAIARAKGEMLEFLREGVFIYNLDDPRLCELASRFQGRSRSFGFADQAGVQVRSCRFLSLQEMDFDLSLPGGCFRARVPFAGRHFLYNIAAAAAVALEVGLSEEQIRNGLKQLRAPTGRGQVFELVRDGLSVTLWDDSYNANPRAVEMVLETFSSVPARGRRIAVLGDMLELGAEAARLHREVGAAVARSSVDLLITVGPLSRGILEGALEEGLDSRAARHFEDPGSAGRWLAARLRNSDFILVKGSRGIGTEAVVQALRESCEVVS